MRIGIVVDSTCDLPQAVIQNNPFVILPVSVRIDNQAFVDSRDPDATREYYRSEISKRGYRAEITPYSAQQIHDLFLEHLVLDYDCVFCLTATASRSPTYAHASQASFSILKGYRPVRQQAGNSSPFLMRVIDTQNLSSAQGITCLEASRMINAAASPGRIRERLETLARHTYGYLLSRNPRYVRARARKRSDHSGSSMLGAIIGSALDIKPILQCYRGKTRTVGKVRGFEAGVQALFTYVGERVRLGLLTRVVSVSYGGDLAELEALPGYEELAQTCSEHRTTLYSSAMSIPGMANVGTAGISLGFAAEPHEPQF